MHRFFFLLPHFTIFNNDDTNKRVSNNIRDDEYGEYRSYGNVGHVSLVKMWLPICFLIHGLAKYQRNAHITVLKNENFQVNK